MSGFLYNYTWMLDECNQDRYYTTEDYYKLEVTIYACIYNQARNS